MAKKWKYKDAKARLDEVVMLAEKGEPQVVTRNGRKCVTFILTSEYRRLVAVAKSQRIHK